MGRTREQGIQSLFTGGHEFTNIWYPTTAWSMLFSINLQFLWWRCGPHEGDDEDDDPNSTSLMLFHPLLLHSQIFSQTMVLCLKLKPETSNQWQIYHFHPIYKWEVHSIGWTGSLISIRSIIQLTDKFIHKLCLLNRTLHYPLSKS